MTQKIDYCVLIGRFQIPHHGHFRLIREALEKAEKVIVAVGSANVGRSLRNPFTFEQRVSFIEHSDIPEITIAQREGRLIFVPIEDSLYSDQWWVEHVQRKVRSVTGPDANVALIGCNKDESSYYIKMFPQWELIELVPERDYAATECRNMYYEFGPHDTGLKNKLYEYTTMGVINALKYIPAQVHKELQDRYFYVKEYREKWGTGPFYTTDMVLIKNGHVLMIKRAGESWNADKWALPGGFREEGENSLEGAIRELEEETGLVLSHLIELEPENIVFEEFNKEDRDDRAHLITHAFRVHLLDEGPLPVVEGKDDAEVAEWVPLVDLSASNCYADHYFIIRKMIAGL